MLGIGLGGFATGFEKGIGIAEKLTNANKQRALDDAMTKGKTDYDAAVTAGTEKPDDADAILRFTMPKIMTPLMQTGDIKGAQAASEWMRSDETRRATKLFGQGMTAAQSGDVGGALNHFVQAGRIKGYGPDVTLDNPQPIEGGGFRVAGKRKDGTPFSKDFKSPDDVIQFGATTLNPVAAFETWQSERTADKAATRSVATDTDKYRNRQGIDVDTELRKKAVGIDGVTTGTQLYKNRKVIDDEHEDKAGDEERKLNTYRTQKDIDLDVEKRRTAAGLGPASYESQNVVKVGPDGKPVVKPYVFDRRSGTAAPMRDAEGNDIDGEVTKPGSRGAGGTGANRKPFQFEVVRDAYKALGYSEKDATDIATGQKPPKDTDLITIARQMTTMEMPASDMRFSAEQRRKRSEEILGDLRTRFKPAGPAAPGGASGTGLPEPGAARSVQAVPTGMGGAGTRAAPFNAATQDHVDWFKKSAPAGAVIIIDGKKYTK